MTDHTIPTAPAAAGAAGPPATAGPPAPEGPAVREPLRAARPAGAAVLHPLTIDLGSHSSTLALFSNEQLTGHPIDPAQEAALLAGLAELLTGPALGALAPAIVERSWELLTRMLPEDRLPARPADPGALADLLDPHRSGTDPAAPGPAKGAATGPALPYVADPAEPYRDAALRHAVTLAVEELTERRADLAPAVHEVHDAAFRQDALRSLRMILLRISQSWDRPEIRSVLAADLRDIRASVLTDRVGAAGSDHHLIVPGLKRWLLRPQPFPALADRTRPPGWPADTDLLVAQAYHDLSRRAEQALAEAVRRGTATPEEAVLVGLPVDQVVVTYPVSTPPAARTRLQRLVQDALRLRAPNDVDIKFDEATAAALYFLLKGFGGDLEAGLAEFRSRAEPLPGAEPPTWRQIMAVTDIGGGTTDIALLAVDLEDHTGRPDPEAGPARPDAPEEQDGIRLAGRRYLLRPRVLGSTGHPQLGGDLVTLRIFYWMKAALADALVAAARKRQAGGGSTKGFSPAIAEAAASEWTDLAPQVLASHRPEPVPPHVRALLRTLLPTHTDRPASSPAGTPAGTPAGAGPRPVLPRSRAFDALWNFAEYTKKDDFAAEQDGSITKPLAADLPADCPFRKDVEALPGPVRLPVAGFEAIVRPMVEEAVRMAADLARQCLGGTYDDRVDLVALSGRTTEMPQVRRIVGKRLVREFSGRADGRRPLAWDPARLIGAGRYAKQAAVLGACWARGTLDYRTENDGRRHLGVDRLDMRIENLLLTLPSGFGLATNRGLPMPWLRAGRPIDLCDPTGRYFVRTAWRRLIPSIDLHRIMGRDRSMEWGRYRYLAHSRPEDGAVLPEDVWFRIELDQELIPTLLLCRGDRQGVRPRLQPFHAGDPAHAPWDGGDLESRPVDLATVPALAGCFEDGRLVRVPGLSARPAGEAGTPVPVFPPGEALTVLEYDFVTDGPAAAARPGFPTPGEVETPGAVSPGPLPTTGPDHLVPEEYDLWADTPGGPVALGRLRSPKVEHLPQPPIGPVPVWALLDGRGRLRLHRGHPAHLEARSLAEMEAMPGYVFRTAMDPGISDWNDDWDPFTGDH
ncbi:hypothetical protein [Kitasatospora sp. NPDC094015]|uniref:hypothetical protein n=1 Tax=Kitasatospora sp. NPDC094015 TaxID=3155205 RepID=UPI003321372C